MIRFILYVIIFYLVIKALNAFFRWLRQPGEGNKSTNKNSKTYSKSSNYKDIEDAQFTEIESSSKKEKVKEKSE